MSANDGVGALLVKLAVLGGLPFPCVAASVTIGSERDGRQTLSCITRARPSQQKTAFASAVLDLR